MSKERECGTPTAADRLTTFCQDSDRDAAQRLNLDPQRSFRGTGPIERGIKPRAGRNTLPKPIKSAGSDLTAAERPARGELSATTPTGESPGRQAPAVQRGRDQRSDSRRDARRKWDRPGWSREGQCNPDCARGRRIGRRRDWCWHLPLWGVAREVSGRPLRCWRGVGSQNQGMPSAERRVRDRSAQSQRRSRAGALRTRLLGHRHFSKPCREDESQPSTHPGAEHQPEKMQRRCASAHSAGSTAGKACAVLSQRTVPVRRIER